MLILSRYVGESFYIGDDIKIILVDVLGEKVRIGIEAPKEIRIYRTELKHRQDEFKGGIPCPKEIIDDVKKLGEIQGAFDKDQQ